MSTDAPPRKSLSPAALLLAGVCALGAVEWVASALAYRSTVSDADIEALVAAPRSGPLRVGTPWLRSRVAAALDDEARRQLAAPDEVGETHLSVVVRAGSEPRGLELPSTPVTTTSFGGLERLDYELPGPARQLDWLDAPGLQIYAGRKRCQAKRGKSSRRQWDCRPGKVKVSTVEVGYEARRCFTAEGLTDRPIRFVLPEGNPDATTLRGHLGFGDFNARLRSDGLASLRVRQDDQTRAAFTLADDQGWRAFEVDLPAGEALELEVRISDEGSYDAKGQYRPRPVHRMCLEARTLDRREVR